MSRLLSIKLTKRTWQGQQVLMCGFPLVHMDRHLKCLVQIHKRFVALCEEFKRSPPEEGFERRVVRVLTPGTLIDESFLNPYENNYLLAIHHPQFDDPQPNAATVCIPPNSMLGLAWIDVSTGEFFSERCTFEGLKDVLTRISPREVVLHTSLRDSNHTVKIVLAEEDYFVSYIAPQPRADIKLVATCPHADDLVHHLETQTVSSPSAEENDAVGLLTTYLLANLLEHMPSVSSMVLQGLNNRMQIDSQTIKALEIKQEMREGGVRGSLLSVIKRTVTSGGTRLLERWLCMSFIAFFDDNILTMSMIRFPQHLSKRNRGEAESCIRFSICASSHG